MNENRPIGARLFIEIAAQGVKGDKLTGILAIAVYGPQGGMLSAKSGVGLKINPTTEKEGRLTIRG
jgi:hypothetical protein